ncbi:antibiotic biosynthesis monooxygenase family protein [Pseudomonas sp. Z18(2022)]|uniref:antibiotic biosynthesis monooxygenase family protein n=1 Tax=Pseudomonas sp. Z18(2022) TaxID=2983410 RepID=UPI002E816C9E|nr:hypothetical protein [Pseudomonas sp. Z18(2022)]
MRLNFLRFFSLGTAVFILVLGAFSVQAAPVGDVVEVVTFKLKPGVTPDQFKVIDKKVEVTHVSKQPGFKSRESAWSDAGEWLVIVHWRSVQDANASMASFKKAPAAATFMQDIESSTMQMKRYQQ